MRLELDNERYGTLSDWGSIGKYARLAADLSEMRKFNTVDKITVSPEASLIHSKMCDSPLDPNSCKILQDSEDLVESLELKLYTLAAEFREKACLNP